MFVDFVGDVGHLVVLAESVDDVLDREAEGDCGVEAGRVDLVVVDEGLAAFGLCDGDDEVVDFLVPGREALEEEVDHLGERKLPSRSSRSWRLSS